MSGFAELANEIDVGEPDKQESFNDLASQVAQHAVQSESIKPAEKGYFQKIADSAKQFQSAVDKGGFMTAPKAAAETVAGMASGAPIGLLKHGIEEGAYLSGQSPNQAANTAQRVMPAEGYQPKSEAGQALSSLVSNVGQPLIDAGKWAAEKAGLSPAAQNIAGDFAPVVIPKAAVAAPEAIRGAIGIAKDTSGAVGRGLTDVSAKFKELQRVGRGESLPAPTPEVTPQMIRGQEPASPAVAMANEPPALTVDNASPELKAVLEKADPGASQIATQRHLEADSLPVKMTITEGQATGNIHKLSDEWNNRSRIQAYADKFNEQNGKLIDNVNAIRERAAPEATGLDHVENGASLIDAYKAKDAIIKQDISAKYKALEDANGGEFPLDGKSFVDAADAALAKKLKSHYVPADVRATLNDLRDGGKMTFEDFETLRSDLAETARSATDGKIRQAASIIRDQLEDMPMPEGAEHLKPLADAARGAAKARFEMLDKDPAYKAAANDSVHADDFVQKYIVNGKRDNLAQMKANIGDDPMAQQSISAAAINYLKSKAGIVNDHGDFSQAGYNKALSAIKPKLDYLFDPVTAQQIQTLGNVARYVKERPSSGYINHSNTFVAAAKDTAKAAIGGAMNVKTMGLSGAVKGAIDSAKMRKAAEASLKPGAGVKISDIPK